MKLNDLHNTTNQLTSSERMPALFIGHGSPMNGIADNSFTKALANMANELTVKPSAVLVISAHWLTRGTHVLTSPKPRTIHDFGGFPHELYNIQYNAPGSPEFAKITRKMGVETSIVNDDQWGLDHGSWTILRHMFPDAEIPVYQLSIDYNLSPADHFLLAQELCGLRDKGVLIIGSGNIVHNLSQISMLENAVPFEWALEFDAKIQKALENRDLEVLLNYQTLGNAAKLAVPSNDHYLPMIYTLGMMYKGEPLTSTFEGFQHGSISMRCFRIGNN